MEWCTETGRKGLRFNGKDLIIMRVLPKTLTLVLMLVLAESFVIAGDMTVNIKEPFKAGDKNYPAGRYRVLADSDLDHVSLVNLDKKTDDKIRFDSRLSPKEGSWGEVIFDKVGNDLYLAEIYIVGMDGFYFKGAPGKHKHVVIKEDVLH
jgi:hypothetical protein